jgi:hypothetical protein
LSDVGSRVPSPNPAETEIDAASLASHYEQDDVSIRGILWFAGGLLVVLVIVHLVLFWVVRGWADRPLLIRAQLAPANVTPAAVPGPGLDAVPEVGLDRLLAGETELLTSYGWIDREGGVVRIPIERAMSLLVEEVMPAREREIPDFGVDPAFQLDSSGGTWQAIEAAIEEEAVGEEVVEDEAIEEEAGDVEASDDETNTEEGEATDE